MYIFHISDIHYSTDNPAGQAKLAKIVESINSQAVKPDVVVVTGDLVWKEHNEYYEPCFQALNKLNAPYLLITGNHDSSAGLIDAIEKYLPAHPRPEMDKYLQYAVDIDFVKIIALDTFRPGHGGGDFNEEKERWFIEQLENNPDKKPVVVLLHQFTLSTGSGFFDLHPGNWFVPFNNIIKKYRSTVKLILCGHLHNSLHSDIFGVPIVSGFSTNWAESLLNYKKSTPERDASRPLAYLIHKIEENRITTYTVTVP